MTMKKSKLAALVCFIAALIVTISWFLPVVKYSRLTLTYLESLEYYGDSSLKVAFYVFVAFFALSMLWAIIPKRWAAIVGIVFSTLLLAFWIIQIADWSKHFTLAVGAILALIMSIILFLASIARLIFMTKEKRQSTQA